MKLASLIICACLLSGAGVCAQDIDGFGEDVNTSLATSKNSIKAALKDVTGKKPRAAVAGATAAAFDADVPEATQAQILNDLAFVRAIQGATASGLHRQIFGLVDGPTYGRFFDSRVKAIGMDDCGGGPSAIACVIPFRDPAKMWLTQNYLKYNQPQISRLDTVFHEARHTESEHHNWHHALCPIPFKDENGNDVRGILSGRLMEGLNACDVTPFGSYGTGMIMLKNIQKFCSNCTDKVRMDAGIYGDDTCNRIIDPDAKKAIREDLYR